MNLPKTMEGSFETAFPDVVKFIDKTYRTPVSYTHLDVYKRQGVDKGSYPNSKKVVLGLSVTF